MARLKVNPIKYDCSRGVQTFLGLVVSSEGISAELENVSAMFDWPTPMAPKEVRALLGLR